MIVVVAGSTPVTSAGTLASAIAARGGCVELVATVASDGEGDRLLVRLARAGIGHAAVLRSPAPGLERADLELALRYLPDVRVIVLLDGASLAGAAATAASWSGAALVVVAVSDRAPEIEAGVGDRSLVIAAPARDPDGAFAGVLADLALRLDAGEDLAEAWSETAASLALEPVSAAGDPAESASGPAADRGAGRAAGP